MTIPPANVRQNLIWAWSCAPKQKLVLLALNDYMGGGKATCWAKTPELMSKTSLPRPTLYRALKALQAAKVITRIGSDWSIDFDRLAVSQGDKSSHSETIPKRVRVSQRDKAVSLRDGSSHCDTPVSHCEISSKEEPPTEPPTSTTHKPPTPSASRRARGGVSESPFEVFWRTYPRREAKRAAETAYERAVKRVAQRNASPPDTPTSRGVIAAAHEYLRDRAETFANSPAGQCGDYIPHPSTWLDQERFEDDESDWRQPGQIESSSTRDATVETIREPLPLSEHRAPGEGSVRWYECGGLWSE